MFILRLFFMIIIIFVIAVAGLGMALMLRIRQHLQNPFHKPQAEPPPARYDSNVIEGEYTVVEDKAEKDLSRSAYSDKGGHKK